MGGGRYIAVAVDATIAPTALIAVQRLLMFSDGIAAHKPGATSRSASSVGALATPSLTRSSGPRRDAFFGSCAQMMYAPGGSSRDVGELNCGNGEGFLPGNPASGALMYITCHCDDSDRGVPSSHVRTFSVTCPAIPSGCSRQYSAFSARSARTASKTRCRCAGGSPLMRCIASRLASSPASTAGGKLALGRTLTDSTSQRICRAVSPDGNALASTSSVCSAFCWSGLSVGACARTAADSASDTH